MLIREDLIGSGVTRPRYNALCFVIELWKEQGKSEPEATVT